jgi:uncharacterized membrane protein (DUF373 family)
MTSTGYHKTALPSATRPGGTSGLRSGRGAIDDEAAAVTAPGTGTPERAGALRQFGGVLSLFESLLYAIIGVLLMAAAVFVVVGTGTATVDAIRHDRDPSEIGVVALDRILLTLIVAELIYSLRLVMQTHEISAQPFLIIGLIATLRRILIVTADFERPEVGPDLTSLLIELGVLGFLVVGLAVAIYLVRASAR